MSDQALVSIICTVFNQEKYVAHTLDSVISQGYENFELIIIDNGSKDDSRRIVLEWIESQKQGGIEFIPIDLTLGYCKAFNIGLFSSQGEYVVDLSGDDLICQGHLEKSIGKLQRFKKAGFCFSDLILFDDNGKCSPFYSEKEKADVIIAIESGDAYKAVIEGNPISASTVVYESAKLKALGGYDESLSYEDFDILVRLTRIHEVVFSEHIGMKKRIHPEAFSQFQYQPRNSKMLPSTVKVCKKIRSMNKTMEENLSLRKRISFELKHAFLSANFEPASELADLLLELYPEDLQAKLIKQALKYRIDFSFIYPTITSMRALVSKYF
ncbi:glycosyltransferase family A protein [Belliella kenyensis]|uniref:Glycosyltransferase family A protein n=1 Tax=Belliella kenyensis TaxID=1472724 RepID=A0ABV8EL64_9BACT|nr:glycosyltransferase family 2 protein [Belliella kenyensis]MCH7400638.1 glycosyltransferase family 2 protein [Belliella kenyensis]MDN3602075.1 glycosyltransferase family 2 protein [Belliella kenyensis]